MTTLLKNFEKWLSIFMLVVMCICIILQVFFRYVLSNALEWPEEIARYSFMCAVFLGASFAADEGRHLEISIMKQLFGKKVRYIVTVISTVVTVLFCAIMSVWGVQFVLFTKTSGQMAASVNLSMYILYIVLPVSMFCMGIRSVIQARRTLQSLSQDKGNQADMPNSW